MATTTYTEWHPHIGSVWQRSVALWESYIGNSAITWTQAVNTLNGHRCVQITLTGSPDTTVYVLVDDSLRSTSTMRIIDVASSAGWRTMPKVQPASQAGRTTLTDFDAKLVALRRLIWPAWTNCALGSEASATAVPNNAPDEIDLFYFTVRFDALFFLDQLTISLFTETTTSYFYNGQQVCDGATDPRFNTVGGSSGGSTVDLTPVVDAIEDLALVDYSLSLNNGASVFSMRGKVRV